ncbi:MAG: hypothetical protein MI739_01880 [Bacteroidales bacterium]|nr:hypothetical protein [Bacteroidales bacterium]
MSSTFPEETNIGVVIVTHANYGAALLSAAEVILGKQDSCATVSVDSEKDVSETVAAIKEEVGNVDNGRGVLILTDMFGGTPTNLSLSLLGTRHLEVLTGVNLPMLLKVFGSRTMTLDRLAIEAKDAGGKGIVMAGEILRSKVNG